jgi:hypothetical protein
MSTEAANWVKWHAPPGDYPKPLLRELADFADADGRVWAAIGTLARILNKKDRQVQRDLAKLRACGLVLETADFNRTKTGQRVPIYQLNFAMPDPSTRGVTDDTPLAVERGGVDDTPSGARGVIHDTPRGVMDDTQAKPGSNTLTADAARGARAQDDFDRLAKVWCEVDPDKLARPKAEPLFSGFVAEGIDPEKIADAGIAFARSGKRRSLPPLHLWLSDRAFEGRLIAGAGGGRGGGVAGAVFPDEKVRAAVVGAKDDAWTRAALDPCGWNAETRTITPRTNWAFTQLAGLSWLLTDRLHLTLAAPSKETV